MVTSVEGAWASESDEIRGELGAKTRSMHDIVLLGRWLGKRAILFGTNEVCATIQEASRTLLGIA